MNKKFYLGAILLGAMTLSTGALTSCIDNDEPEGITNLRGAKAELLRAKAAVELAKAETEKQNANWVAALAAVEQANAKIAEAKAKQEEAIAKQEEAKVAYEQAKSEEAKAKALIAMADAQQAQAAAEANIEAIKAENEVYLQMQKNQLLQAQNDYDKLVAEIEAAKAVLTDEQAKKLAGLQKDVDKAWKKYTEQQGEVLTAMKKLFNATNKEVDEEEILRDALAKAEAKLEAVNAAYGELKTLSENVAPTAWEARMDSLKAYGNTTNGTHKLEIAELELKKEEIKQSEAYKTAFVEDTTARRAYITAQQLYNYLADATENDCFMAGDDHKGLSDEKNTWGYEYPGTHPSQKPYKDAKKYDLQGAKIVITNPTVYKKLVGTPGLVSDWQGMRLEVDGTFVADGGGEKYSKLKNAFNSNVKDPAKKPAITNTVAKWEEVLRTIKVTNEEIAADSCIADYQNKVLKADSVHKAEVAKWKKAHKTYSNQAVETSVSTNVFKAAIKTYNDNIDALEAAVTAYNNARDAALTANTATIYNALKEVYEVEAYKDYLTTDCPDAQVKAYFSNPTKVTANQWAAAKTVAGVDQIVASCEADINGFSDPDYKTVAKLQAAAKKAVNKSFVIDDAEDAINEVAESKAKLGVIKGGTVSVASLSISATFANGIPSVNDTKAVKDAYAVIYNTDSKKPGLIQKLNATGYEENDDHTTKAYTGAFGTIARAIADFKALAKENSEKLTEDAKNATLRAKVEEYTGTKTKFHEDGDAKDSEPSATFSDGSFIKPLVYLDEEKEKYVMDVDKYMVVRTKVSDENIAAMSKVEFDPDVAEENWQNASKKAFGTDESNSRHTELTEALINKTTSPYTDENGKKLNNWVGSTLQKLVDAKQALANHQNLEGVNAEIDSLKVKVAEAKAAMLAQIAEYTAAVNEAKAAIEPAKKEHQAKHKAAEALLKPVQDEIKKIEDIAKEYMNLAGELQDILNAYYAINEFSYVDENGITQKVNFKGDKNFTKVEAWLKSEIAKYEKKDPAVKAPETSDGKIKDAEAAVATAQKELDRWIADGEFDAVAKAQLALDNAQALLETLKARYDFALSQLNDYVAALSK